MFKNKRGASLVLVLIVFAFVLIIGAGAVVIAGTSSNQTTQSLAQKQADFTAQSVLNAVIGEIKAGIINPGATAITGAGSDVKLGGYSYTISSYTSGSTPNLFKVSVDAWYPQNLGSHSKMYSVIQGIRSGAFSAIAQTTALTSYVPDNFSNSSEMQGDLILNEKGGTATFSNNGSCGTLKVDGKLDISNGYTVNGNIYATGDVTISSNARVNGSIYSNGNVTAPGVVTGSINRYLTGALFTAPATSDWTVTPEIMQSMVQLKINVAVGTPGQNYTVSGNDTIINKNSTVTITNSASNKNLVFDASSNDLYIMLATSANNGSTLNFSKLNILSKGTHSVFLFLDDGTNYVNLQLTNGSFAGYYNYQTGIPGGTTVTPNLYIISNKLSNVNMITSSSLYGYIYMPRGSLSMANGSILNGAFVTSSINIANAGNFKFFNTTVPVGGLGGNVGNWTGWNTQGTYPDS